MDLNAILENKYMFYGFFSGCFFLLLFSCVLCCALMRLKNKFKKLELGRLEAEILKQQEENAKIQIQNRCRELEDSNTRLVAENSKLNSDLDNQQKYMNEKIAYIERNKEELALKFRDISNEIIKAQNKQFNEEQKNAFTLMLKPFQEQMNEFRHKVEAAHEDSLKNKSSFDEQLKNLLSLNQTLSKDAQDLSTALKGGKKLQGNWGEFQLERVLEISGLQKGINYETQETFKNEDNRVLRPDVIVKLPNDRSVIIDSKVSLNDYMAYVNCDNEVERAEYLKKHIQCIKGHIDELSCKEYQKLLKDSSLDYVVIFIPVESAYVEAVRADNGLYDYAYRKNVAMTTPSSLLPILRTIENLWRIENQNKYVGQIATVGGSLYDKLANFVEDMQRIDKALDTARKNYDQAVGKLSTGKGNALSLAGKLKEFGAKANKTLGLAYEDGNEEPIGKIMHEAVND